MQPLLVLLKVIHVIYNCVHIGTISLSPFFVLVDTVGSTVDTTKNLAASAVDKSAAFVDSAKGIISRINNSFEIKKITVFLFDFVHKFS